MESILNTLRTIDTNTVIATLVTLIVVYVVYKCFFAKESFAETNSKAHSETHSEAHSNSKEEPSEDEPSEDEPSEDEEKKVEGFADESTEESEEENEEPEMFSAEIQPATTQMELTRQGTVTPYEYKEQDREITINPPYNNSDTRTIMAGSGFIPQKDIVPAWGNNYGLVDDLDDGAGGNFNFNYNLCSPSCCSAQYPTPHKLKKDPLVCGREDEFTPTNYMCNNAWQNSGCLCATKEQVAFLSNRGNNA